MYFFIILFIDRKKEKFKRFLIKNFFIILLNSNRFNLIVFLFRN